jgi:hypothetical protein
MKKPIDLIVSKERLKVAVEKAITSLTLLEKELEKNEIDLSLIHDYASESQGYLTRIFRFVYALARIEETNREVVSGMSSNKA